MTHDPSSAESDEQGTGLPWPRTWCGVYLFVVGCFMASVLLLTTMTLLLA